MCDDDSYINKYIHPIATVPANGTTQSWDGLLPFNPAQTSSPPPDSPAAFLWARRLASDVNSGFALRLTCPFPRFSPSPCVSVWSVPS